MPDKILFLLLLVLVLLTGCKSEPRVDPQSLTERERDGLIGNVRATLTDDVVLDEQNGQWMEVQQASSTTLYDAAGKRTLQTPFRVMMANGFAITQHELLFDPIAVPTNSNSKKYVEHDNKGNVVERGDQDNGKRIAVELFVKYEFDMRGNWIKRTLLRPVEKSGKKELQPSEISHRQIIYADSVKAEAPVELIPATAKQLKSPIAATEENLAAGKNLFLQRCAACHGENGKAKTEFAAVMPTKPADLTEQPAISLTEGEVFSAASEGIKASGMPGLKGRISDEAIWKIAMYVRQLPLDQARAETIAKASPTPTKPVAPDAERRYQLTGKIVSVENELKQVTIEHEDIKGYMEAMTMPFPLRDEKLLARAKAGDRIKATVVVGGAKGFRLENVVIR